MGQGLVNQVRSIGNQVSDGLAGSVGQATGTLAQGAFQGIGAGLGNLGQGILNPHARIAGQPGQSSGSSGGYSGSNGLVQDALVGGASLFPEAAGFGGIVGSAGGKHTRILLQQGPTASLATSGGSSSSSSSGDGSSNGRGSSSSGGGRGLKQVDFFAAPMALNDFVSQGVTSGSFGTQLGQDAALNSQIQAGLSALAGTGTGIGGNALGANTGRGGLAALARLAGLGGGGAEVFNTGGGNGALGGLGGILSNVVGGAARKRGGGGLGGLLSGLAHGRGSNADGSSGSDGSVEAASLAQFGGNAGSSTMYNPFSQQQVGYTLEQGQQQNPQQQQTYMNPDLYDQAFQQLQKVPGQAAGALAGYGTGLANQGIQTFQNLGNQIQMQAGQSLANGEPLLGSHNQPMVVQGLGQDPNTYVIGGSDYYPGGSGVGQTQQFNTAGNSQPAGLVTGQFVPSTARTSASNPQQFAGGSLGSGGQFVSEPTQPAGPIDPITGEFGLIIQQL